MSVDYQKTLIFNVDNNKFLKYNLGFENVAKLINEYLPNKYVFVNTAHGTFTGPDCFIKNTTEYDEKIVERANEVGVIFFMWEPICCYSKSNNHLELSFYHEFDHQITDIYSYEIDHIINFCVQAGLYNYEIKICDYDKKNLLSDSYPQIKISYTDIYVKSMPFVTPGIIDNNLCKRFICPNARYTPHRHLVMCHLADKNGIYSWNFECEEYLIEKISWLDKNNPYYQRILNNNEILNENSYTIDHDLPKIWVKHLTDFETIEQSIDHVNKKDFYKDVFCAVVNETRFAQPFSNFSEKVLRPINYNLPFLLVAPPFTLSLLRDYGFKTFSKWWDENYDLEEDHSKRLYKIFSIIDYIDSLSQREVEKIYEEMIPTLLFNSAHLQNIDRSI